MGPKQKFLITRKPTQIQIVLIRIFVLILMFMSCSPGYQGPVGTRVTLV